MITVSKTLLRQALHVRFGLGATQIAKLTGSTRMAVRMTIDPKLLVTRGGKPWVKRATQERHRAILAAEKLFRQKIGETK